MRLGFFSAAMILAGCGDKTVSVRNAIPEVVITSPASGYAASEGEELTVEGYAGDADDAAETLSARWTVDGEEVCTAAPESDGTTACTFTVEASNSEIQLVVVDPSGGAGEDSITITVEETEPPVAEITSPEANTTFSSDALISLEGVVSDTEDDPEDLTAVWTSSLDSDFSVEAEMVDTEGTVRNDINASELSAGDHSLTLTVTDTSGKRGTDSVVIKVRTQNEGPTCEITAPESGASAVSGTLVTFEATVSDDAPVEELTIEWLEDGAVLETSVAETSGTVTYATSTLSAGPHNITLSVTDVDGATCTDDITYIVGSPPSVTIGEPVADVRYYAGELIELSGTTNDAEDDEEDITIAWTTSTGEDLSGLDTTVNSDGTFSSFTTLDRGEHALIVTATDTTGLTSEDTVIITVGDENSPPTCEITSPASGDTVPSGTIVFTGMALDDDEPEGGLAVSFRTDGTDGADAVELGATTSDSSGSVLFTTSAIEAGTHVIRMEVTDEVGDTCSTSIVLNVGSAPSVLITAPEAGTIVNEGDALTLTGLVSDDEDTATELVVEWSSSIDGPIGVSTPSAAGLVDITADDLAAGTHTITLTAVDTDGESASATLEVVVNGLPSAPVVGVTPGTPAIGDDLVAGITTDAVDPESGDVTYTYTWEVDGAPSDITEATVPASETSSGEVWTVTATAHDEYGMGGSASASVTVNNAPACDIYSPAGGEVVPSGTVYFSAEATDTEDDATTLLIEFVTGEEDAGLGTADADSDGNVMFTTDALASGMHVVTMVVTDALGDSCEASVSFGIGSPPTVTITAPADGTVVNEGESITFTGTVDDAESAVPGLTIQWRSDIDGVLDGTAADDSGGVFFIADGLTIGTHTITLQATDSDMETNMDMVTVRINGLPEAPAVAITPTTPKSTDDLTATIVTPGTDPEDGVASSYTYAWSKDGVDAGITSDTVPGTSTVSGEVWAVTVTSVDADGASGGATTDSVTINTPPTCAITDPVDGDTEPPGTVTFTATATDIDEDSDALSVVFSEATLGELGTATSTGGAVTFGTTALDIGTHVVSMNVTDSAGETCAASVTIEVGGAPTVAITGPADGAIFNDGEAVSFTGTATDVEDDAAGEALSITWVSSLEDGTLNSDAPASDGTLAFTTSDLSVGDHIITLSATDSDGQTSTETVEITINGLPTAPTVTLTPASPTTTDDLVATATGSTDEDGDDITYTYAWTLGGAATVYAGDTIPASATSSGDVWAVTVTASDADGTGGSSSASVTVANTAPVVDSVTLSPDDVFTNDTIEATASYSDADGDTATVSYVWTVSGSVVADETGPSLSGVTHFDKGDTVFVTVTATDADGSSAPVSSASVTVLNTAPTAHTIAIDPDSPIEGEDAVQCKVDTAGTDADGDTITYSVSWEIGGVAYTDTDTTTLAGDTVPAGATAEAEVWTCTMTSSDGEAAGSTATASVTIGVDCDKDDDGYKFERADCETVADLVDCNDADPSINPGADEIWYDGVDRDCSGGSDYDADEDGYDAIDYGGEDCADEDPTRIDCSDGIADYLEGEEYGPVAYHSLETDTANDRLILYGGQQYHQLSGSTNAYSLTDDAWEVVSTAGIDPDARMGHASAMDNDGGKMYVFGGQMYHTLSDELMVLDTTTNTWSFVEDDFTGLRPPPLTGASMVYDPNLDQLHVFGGQGYHGLNNELWTYSVATDSWVGVVYETGPVAAGMVAIFNPDAEADDLTPGIAFGGQTYHKLADTGWCFDGTGFSALTITGDALPPAVGMAYAMAPTFGGIVAYGGQTYHNLVGDAYLIRMTDDCTVDVELLEEGPDGPPPTVGSAMAWSEDDAEAFLVGGQTFYKLSEKLHGITP